MSVAPASAQHSSSSFFAERAFLQWMGVGGRHGLLWLLQWGGLLYGLQ